MRKYHLIAAALIAPVLMPAVAAAQSLPEALALAYAGNPQLEAERARVRAIDETYVQARSGYLPRVQLNADVQARFTEQPGIFGGTRSDTLYPRSAEVVVSQQIWNGGRTPAQVRQTEAQINAAYEGLRQLEQTILLQVVAAYVDVRRDLQVVEARAANVDRLAKQREAAGIRFDVGEITRTDVAQAEARLAQARAGLATASAQLEVSRAAFVRTVGEVPGSLSPEPNAPALPASLTAAVELGLDRNPQLLSAKSNVVVAREAVKVQRADLNPQFGLQARVGRTVDGTGPGLEVDGASASATMSVPLYEAGLVRSRVRQSKQTVEQAERLVDDARRVVTQSVARSWADWQASLNVITASQEQLAASQLALEGANEELAVGLRTTLDVLDAEQEVLEARLQLIAAQRNAYVAAHQVLAATGTLNLSTLGVNQELYDPRDHLNEVKGSPWQVTLKPVR
jgi:outer membrane protein